jgi:hypothetical protein
MYKKAYKIMGIDELSDDLKYEVEKLHNFIDLQNSKENSKRLTKIQNFVWFLSILGVWTTIVTSKLFNPLISKFLISKYNFIIPKTTPVKTIKLCAWIIVSVIDIFLSLRWGGNNDGINN